MDKKNLLQFYKETKDRVEYFDGYSGGAIEHLEEQVKTLQEYLTALITLMYGQTEIKVDRDFIWELEREARSE